MFDYKKKFDSYPDKTLLARLPAAEQDFIRTTAFNFRLTFQEFRQVVNAARDLEMWSEPGLAVWWKRYGGPAANKKVFLGRLNEHLQTLRRAARKYASAPPGDPAIAAITAKPVIYSDAMKNIAGPCPVASPRTLCCQLQTIDAVENCVYGCSYCTIQTFYTNHTVVNTGLAEKLAGIKIEAGRYFHFGSGQASDSLALGNIGGVLDDLCSFAAAHPNVLLEFKTKSGNIDYFLKNSIPPNVVCSWSLNPEIIIAHEEHFTAGLQARLSAARRLADRGIKTAFHFHPMIHYHGWSKDYPALAHKIMEMFTTEEVLFLSFGSLTLIKPVIQKIRTLGSRTKILQMELVPDPHGKLTCPDSLKIRLFRKIHAAFKPWQDKVYMYLCMETPAVWSQVFGFHYRDNSEFEQDFARKTIGKIMKQRQ